MNTKSLTVSRYHEVEDCEPIPEEIQAMVRRVICGNAVGETLDEQVADAAALMRILGVFPGDEADTYLTGPAPSVQPIGKL